MKTLFLILLIVGFIISMLFSIQITLEQNNLQFSWYFSPRISLIEIALRESSEKKFQSQIVSIIYNFLILFFLLLKKNKVMLIGILTILNLAQVFTEVYYINQVMNGDYIGGHIRIVAIIFILGIITRFKNE